MLIPEPYVQPVLAWLKEQAAQFGPAVLALALLGLCAPFSHRAIAQGRLGKTSDAPALSLAPAAGIALAPVLFWLWCLWLSQAHESTFVFLVQEDGMLEYGQALVLAVATLLGAAATRRLWRAGWWGWAGAYGLFALGLLWLAGEEISWGQRMLNFETPPWFAQHNYQRELNFHNLQFVNPGITSWFDWVLSWAAFLSAASWLLGLPRVRALRLRLWLPHPVLIPALACVVSYGEGYRLYELLYPGADASEVLWRLQEPKEAVLYFAFAAFLWLVHRVLPPADRARPA